MTATTRGKGVPFASVLVVLAILGVLALLPRLITPTKFTFEIPGPKTEARSFPMDRRFPVVAGGRALKGNPKEVSFGDLAASSPNGILVNFWATWCPPCLDELPSLDFLNRQLSRLPKSKVPILVTVSVDEEGADVTGLFETLDFSPTLLVLHDPAGYFSASYGTTRFPETYWIAPDGSIRFKWIGPQNWLSEEVLLTLLPPSER